MKKLILICALAINISLYAQNGTTISFDYYQSVGDNDLVNNFNNGTGLMQIPDSGISGGSLQTPATINWGNDNAIFCKRTKSVANESSSLSINFLFDSTLVDQINFDRAASLWFNPSADWNHYFIAECNPNSIRALTYYSAQSYTYNLQHRHWYELTARLAFSATPPLNSTYKVSLLDRGLSGLDSVPAASINFQETDSVLGIDQDISVSFTGAQYGGAKFMDNFHFDGDTSFSNCIVNQLNGEPGQALVLIQHNTLRITDSKGIISVKMLSLDGRILFSEQYSSDIERPLGFLKTGVYFLQIQEAGKTRTHKFFISAN
jgi:hypothetical protein